MILRSWQWQHGTAIGQHEEAGLFAFHEFLDDNFRSGFAEFAVEHHGDGIFCLFQRFGDNDAFACRKTVGLDHDWCALFTHIAERRFLIIEARPGGCWCAAGVADFLGEGLRCLELCSCLVRSKHANPVCAQHVRDPGCQRGFRPDYDEIDFRALDKCNDCSAVVDVQPFDAARDLGDPGISGRAVKCLDLRRLEQLPGKRVFAAASAQDENVHGNSARFCCRQHHSAATAF